MIWRENFSPNYKDVFDFLLAPIVFKLFTFYCAKFNTFANALNLAQEVKCE